MTTQTAARPADAEAAERTLRDAVEQATLRYSAETAAVDKLFPSGDEASHRCADTLACRPGGEYQLRHLIRQLRLDCIYVIHDAAIQLAKDLRDTDPDEDPVYALASRLRHIRKEYRRTWDVAISTCHELREEMPDDYISSGRLTNKIKEVYRQRIESEVLRHLGIRAPHD